VNPRAMPTTMSQILIRIVRPPPTAECVWKTAAYHRSLGSGACAMTPPAIYFVPVARRRGVC
jgi:hypothetical protein